MECVGSGGIASDLYSGSVQFEYQMDTCYPDWGVFIALLSPPDEYRDTTLNVSMNVSFHINSNSLFTYHSYPSTLSPVKAINKQTDKHTNNGVESALRSW